MRRLIAPFARLCVVLAVALAMTGSSFAHRSAPSDIDESLLAYVTAGGTLEDLCGQAGLGSSAGNTCDACRLVDSAMLPPSGTVGRSELYVRLLQGKIKAGPAPITPIDNPACPVRAPPVV